MVGSSRHVATPGDRLIEAAARVEPAIACWHCGDALRLLADVMADEYVWIDESGANYALDYDLRHICGGNPYMRLKQLADRLAACRGSITPESDRDIEEYAALSVRIAGGTFHRHTPVSAPVYDGPRFSHCDYPGWLRPSGWQCRVCHARMSEEPDGWVGVRAANEDPPRASTRSTAGGPRKR
jgi:hypothetical protein